MNAMPAASALPVRNRPGKVQNAPRVDMSPMAAMVNAIMLGTGECTNALAANPAAPMKLGNATCQNRSPVRSELAPTTTMAMAAAA